MTYVEDKICWWQLWDVGDRFNPLKHQRIEKVANIMILSPTSQISHQHNDVTNITVTQKAPHQEVLKTLIGFNRSPEKNLKKTSREWEEFKNHQLDNFKNEFCQTSFHQETNKAMNVNAGVMISYETFLNGFIFKCSFEVKYLLV